MKKLYTLTTTLLALSLFSFTASAQTFAFTYKAVRNGNWVAATLPQSIWDVSGQPPANCGNCLITINSGVTVTLNTDFTLSNSSVLQIGTDEVSGAAELLINSSNGSDFTNSNNVIILNDGSTPANRINLRNSSSFIIATGADASFDGVFTTFPNAPTTFFKQVGNGPSAYSGTTVANNMAASRNTLAGAAFLTGDGTLPITLMEFEAALIDNIVDLNWKTSQEINSDHFVVQRSVDAGSHWTNLGVVAAGGSSFAPINYSFRDLSPVSGTDEYRLQMVDRDGQFTYSGVQTIRTGLISSLSIYPNPARDFVNVTLGGQVSGSVSIRLISQSGQLLLEKRVNNGAGTTVSLPVGTYPQGNYLILVAGSDGSTQTSKLLISKQ